MTSDDAAHKFWCLVQGSSKPFEVIAPVNASINRLQELVRKKKRKYVALRNADANDLILWKVGMLWNQGKVNCYELMHLGSSGIR